MDSLNSKQPYPINPANRSCFSPPSGKNSCPTNTPTNSCINSPTYNRPSPTTTMKLPFLISPASRHNTLMISTTIPYLSSTGYTTPSPTTTDIVPWLGALGSSSPVQHNSPAKKPLKLKSPKVEVDGRINFKTEVGKEAFKARPLFKRNMCCTGSTRAAILAKCIKLFHSPKGDSLIVGEMAKRDEVIEISDDDSMGLKARNVKRKKKYHDLDGEKKEACCGDTFVENDEVRRLIFKMESATTSLFTDLEILVCSVGQMIEATIGICNYATRGA